MSFIIWSRRLSATIITQPRAATTALTTHEDFCPKNAARFVATRGRIPRSRTRQQFVTWLEAQAYGTGTGDGRTMIFAVPTHGHSAHITSA